MTDTVEAVSHSTPPRDAQAQPRWILLVSSRWFGVLSFAALMAMWELVGRTIYPLSSRPTAVVSATYSMVIAENVVWPEFLATLRGLVVGFVVAVAIGIPVGLAMARIRSVDIALDPYVTTFYATPRIALIPLLMLWVGIGFGLRLSVVVLLAVFPIIINTYVGAKAASKDHLDVAAVYGAHGWKLTKTVLWPSGLPYLMAGLRMGLARSLIGIIVAELLVGRTGLGGLMKAASERLQVDRLLVPILILGGLAILLQLGMRALERMARPWAFLEQPE